MRGKRTKDCNIELGLAISALSLKYGQRRTHNELAAFCGCSRSNIQYIEDRALAKLRKAVKKDEFAELITHLKS